MSKGTHTIYKYSRELSGSLLQFKVKTDLFTPLADFLLKRPFSKWYKHDITKHSALKSGD